MIVRLIPYSQVFVSVTLDLDETAAVVDALQLVARSSARTEASAVAERLAKEMEEAMERAVELQKKGI